MMPARLLLLIVLGCGLSACLPLEMESPPVLTMQPMGTALAHPYVLLTPARLAEIRRRYADPAPGSLAHTVRQHLLDAADGYLREPLPPFPPSYRGHDAVLMSLALAYLLTDDTRYADHALAWADALLLPFGPDPRAWDAASDLQRSEFSFGLAAVYDWLHARIPPDQRLRFRAAATAWQARLASDDVYTRTYPDPTDAFDRSLLFDNHYLYNNAAMALLGYALLADYPEDEQIQRLVALAEGHFATVLEALPADGYHPEGIAYGGTNLYALLLYLEARLTARGENGYAGQVFLQNAPQHVLYGHFPNGDQLNLSDAYYPRWWCLDALSMGRLAAAYDDPLAQRLAIRALTDCDADRVNPALTMLFFDPEQPAMARATQPLHHTFPDAGLVVSRSDWSPQAAYFAFKSGPHRVPHAHPDQNTVLLSLRGEHLIVDHGYTLNKRTADENTLVYKHAPNDPGWTGQSREGNEYYYALSGNPPGMTGELVESLALGPHYLGATGEAAGIYTVYDGPPWDTHRLDAFTRDVVSVGHRFYVVHDWIATVPEQPLLLQTRYHTRARVTERSPRHFRLDQNGVRLHLLFANDAGVAHSVAPSLIIPESLPPEPGRVPATRYPYNDRLEPYVDGQYLAATTEAAVEAVHLLTVLYPGSSAPTVTRSADGAGRRAVHVASATHAAHLLFSAQPGPWTASRVTTDGAIAVVDQPLGRAVEMFALHRGTVLEYEGQLLAAADTTTSVVARYQRRRLEAVVQLRAPGTVAIALAQRPRRVEVGGISQPFEYARRRLVLTFDTVGRHAVTAVW